MTEETVEDKLAEAHQLAEKVSKLADMFHWAPLGRTKIAQHLIDDPTLAKKTPAQILETIGTKEKPSK